MLWKEERKESRLQVTSYKFQGTGYERRTEINNCYRLHVASYRLRIEGAMCYVSRGKRRDRRALESPSDNSLLQEILHISSSVQHTVNVYLGLNDFVDDPVWLE